MYSEVNKKPGEEILQTEGEEKNDTIEECDCIYCMRSLKPRLQFVTTKGHRWYYQTQSRKNSHR